MEERRWEGGQEEVALGLRHCSEGCGAMLTAALYRMWQT